MNNQKQSAKKPPADPPFLEDQAAEAESESAAGQINPLRWLSMLRPHASGQISKTGNAGPGKPGPLVKAGQPRFCIMASYDYLGLIGHPKLEKASIQAIKIHGTGSGGLRLRTGTNLLQERLERVIAEFKGTGSAMVFQSGYMANITAINGLFGKQDRILVDEFVHPSILDGAKLLGLKPERFIHNDMVSLESLLSIKSSKARTLIIVEGIYPMEGDCCPLDAIIALKEKYGALVMVDEAHSFAVMGTMGTGVNEYYQISPDRVDIFTGSLSKAIPSNGGFIAAKKDVILHLKKHCDLCLLSASLSPASTATAIRAIELIYLEKWRLSRLWENSSLLINGLKSAGFNTGSSRSQLVTIMMGSAEKTLNGAKKLLDLGFITNALVYPAVPAHLARLRVCATASQTREMIQHFLASLKRTIS
jgi:7-keto-8-aminopelargonate synthetase-like enzyme